MLFEPARHEPLDPSLTWDEARARAAIEAIVGTTVRERTPASHWLVHPLDAEGNRPRTGYKSLYLGSAGVLWALWTLAREGAAAEALDAAEGIEQALASYVAEPDDSGEVVPSYFLGETGIQLVRWRITGSAAAADRVYECVRANIGNPTNEALWAAPGTVVAAWHLWCATHEARWRDLFLDNVEQVWRTWLFDEKAGCHLWTQDMYGSVAQYLGAGHGFAGNVYPLLMGGALLSDDRRETLYERCVTMLRTFALREDGAVNWPSGTFTPRSGSTRFLMQWCHGAPGIVTALSAFPRGHSAELDELLLAAGEAIWRAGPLAKGHGICHGTAGNGYALLKLFRRSGDEVWLTRARAFAMHAIGQCERMRERHGQGRHTLWTGDTGLALFLWHCRDGTDALPSLDFV